jgi:uncharacterized cofD-like protein
VIVLGPGSLYTSILPNLLIPGILDAAFSSKASVVLPINLMTQPGETDGMDAVGHLDSIERHCGPDLVGTVLVNDTELSTRTLDHYAEVEAIPVFVDQNQLALRGKTVVSRDLLAAGELVRHDPEKLCRAIIDELGNFDRR